MAPTLLDMETFQHEKLPDASTYLRLLRITSIDETRDILVHCELTTWPKAAMPIYTAISYTWGNRDQVATILVNGKKMQIRRNCEDVLKQPCWNKGGYFWIDAICINQVNDDEKSFQVAMMSNVFKDAAQTLACVGRHQDDSEFLFEMLRRFQYRWQVCAKYYSQSLRSKILCWGLLPRKSTMMRLFITLNMFLKRSYFHRVWIYQELAFGKDIQICCEDSSAKFTWLWALYLNMMKSRIQSSIAPLIGDSMVALELWYEVLRTQFMLEAGVAQMTTRSFTAMMHDVHQLYCEDPRDRVYGTLSMICWQTEEPIQPDYTKDSYDLAIEVLRRHNDGDDFFTLLKRTSELAKDLGVPESRRLVDAIQERRSNSFNASLKDAASVPLTFGTRISGPFGAYRLWFHSGGWGVQHDLRKECGDQPTPGDDVLLAVQQWSTGQTWDWSADILLSQDAQPEDWLLLSTAVRPSIWQVAFIARETHGGRLQLVGKAFVTNSYFLFSISRRMSRLPEGAVDYDVCLDVEDLVLLCHSMNWEVPMRYGGPGKLDRTNLDRYFETTLYGRRGCSYATPLKH